MKDLSEKQAQELAQVAINIVTAAVTSAMPIICSHMSGCLSSWYLSGSDAASSSKITPSLEESRTDVVNEYQPLKDFHKELDEIHSQKKDPLAREVATNKLFEGFVEKEFPQFVDKPPFKGVLRHVMTHKEKFDQNAISGISNVLEICHQHNVHKELTNFLAIVTKNSDTVFDLLCQDRSGGFMTHQLFNQRFKILTPLLEKIDDKGIGEEKIRQVLEKRDKLCFKATLLDAASIMWNVAPPQFKDQITRLYSKYPPQNLDKTHLMLDQESFEKIYTEQRLAKMDLGDLQRLAIISEEFLQKGGVESLMKGVELNPCSLFLQDGYEKTTTRQIANIEELRQRLLQGDCASVRPSTIEEITQQILDRQRTEGVYQTISVHQKGETKEFFPNSGIQEQQITKVHQKNTFEGIVPNGGSNSIAQIAKQSIEQNLARLQRIIEARRGQVEKPSSAVRSASMEEGVYGAYR